MKAVASVIGGAVLLSAHGVLAEENVPTPEQINAQIERLLNGAEVEPLGEVAEQLPQTAPLPTNVALGEEPAVSADTSVVEAETADTSSPIDQATDTALADPTVDLSEEPEISADSSDATGEEDKAIAQVPLPVVEEPQELRVKASDGMRNSLAALRQRTLENPIPYPQPIALAPRSVHGPLAKGGSYLPPSEYRDIARKVAQMHSVPEDLFFKLVKAESNWNQDAVSRVGALGLAQLMPGTAKYLGVDPMDPFQNLEGGARYLSEQYKKFGSWELALAAYNAGPGAVQQYGGIPPYAETQAYVQKILFN